MADRTVDFLLIGGGVAAGNCARWLASLRGRRLHSAGGARARPALRPPTVVQGVSPGCRDARRCAVPDRRLVRRAADRGAGPYLGDEARSRLAYGHALQQGPGGVRQGTDRHRGQRPPPQRPGGGAGGHPLPAHVRQQRRHPRGGRGQAGGPDRRLLHRLRGRGDAHRARQRLHDGHARGARADPLLRPRGGRVLP